MQRRTSSLIRLFCAIGVTAGLTLALAGCSAAINESATTGSNGNTASGQPTPGKAAAIKEGNVAPDFEFTTTEGTTAKLSDYSGHVVLLNFWASWCGPCMQEMPALGKIADTFPEVRVVAINRGDSDAKATSTAKELGYPLVWGLDGTQALTKLYPSNGIPFSIIIDKDGVISSIFEGSAADMYPHFEKAVVKAGA